MFWKDIKYVFRTLDTYPRIRVNALVPSKLLKVADIFCLTWSTSAPIPYSDAAVTLGRKAIRDLWGLKSFNDIRHI